MITGHGGNIFAVAQRLGCGMKEILDMSSNMNPLGPMPELMLHIKNSMDTGTFLPEADAGSIVKLFARQYDISPDQVLAGNGTTQFIYMLPQALSPDRVVIMGPTYADYEDAAAMFGITILRVNASEENLFVPDLVELSDNLSDGDLVFICNVNNPTGTLISRVALEDICRKHPDTLFVIDESYLAFARNGDRFSMIPHIPDNCLVLHSMSKIHKIPGLRAGFLVARRKIADRVRKFHLPWSVNGPAQSAVAFLLTHPSKVKNFILESRDYVKRQMSLLQADLSANGLLKAFPSEGPFFLIKLPDHLNAHQVYEMLCSEKILIRNCANFFGLSDQFIRISLKSPIENRRVTNQLFTVCRRTANAKITPEEDR